MAEQSQASMSIDDERGYSTGTIALSWGVSLAVHLLIFILMVLAPWLVEYARDTELPFAKTQIVGEIDATLTSVAHQPKLNSTNPVPKEQLFKVSPQRFEMLSESPSTKPRGDLSIIGIGAGGGGELSRFGLETTANIPGPEFFGLGQEARGARRIVYVVDKSGSMMDTFRGVQNELKRSIGELRRSQKFHVIFFSEDYEENRPRKLVSAINARKKQADSFIDQMTSGGATLPIGAMERAFDMEPDVIYFLTDGEFEPELLERLREWNKRKNVRIYTIAYVSQAGRPLLQLIAREHNGEFKYVSGSEINFD
jgi:hypothetical protein